MGVDKEGIILQVVECQHGWIFSALCVVVGLNVAAKSDCQSLLQCGSLFKLNTGVKLNACVANLSSYSL